MKINRENVKWSARLMSIILLVAAADSLVAMFMPRPFPRTVIMPAFTSLLVALFVILQLNRADRT